MKGHKASRFPFGRYLLKSAHILHDGGPRDGISQPFFSRTGLGVEPGRCGCSFIYCAQHMCRLGSQLENRAEPQEKRPAVGPHVETGIGVSVNTRKIFENMKNKTKQKKYKFSTVLSIRRMMQKNCR